MPTALATALNYIALGWAVVPIGHKEKRPSVVDWPGLRIGAEDAQRYFNGAPQNIGVILGEASNGLVDIDLDCAEAIAAAPYFLPRTRSFGRASKRASHWLYYSDLAQTEERATVQFKEGPRPLLECRVGATGAQTVFPPSVHPSGEEIRWEDNNEITRIDGGELLVHCARIAAVSLLARHFPAQGGRHEAGLIVGGFLAGCGFDEPAAKLFGEALCAASAQPPDKRHDIVRAIGDTVRDAKAGRDRLFGYPKLAAVFGDEAARRCADWLGFKVGEAFTDPAPPAEAVAIEPPRLDVFDVGDETGDIAPREWLLGKTFCRGFLSGLIAAGGFGKTTLRILQALELATNRKLTGEHIFVRCRVMFVCLEDDLKELRRRVWAAMLHHGIKPEDVRGHLFLTSPRRMKVAELGGKAGGERIRGGLYHAIVAQIEQLGLDLICIDPAVKAHGFDENDNAAIDDFAAFLTEIASRKNVAVDLLSHERKGSGDPGDVNRGRGAGSQKDAARLVYTLTPMSEEDARPFGIGEEERRFLVRVDSAKVNIAPPSVKASWFRLVGVSLNNATVAYPAGDSVQAFEQWTPVPLFEGLSEADINAVLRRINGGMADGRRYSTASAAKDRAAWRAVQAEHPALDEKRCRAIVSAWVRNKLFEEGEYVDPIRRHKGVGILSARLIGPVDDVD